MGYNLLVNGVYWGYNPLTSLLLTPSGVHDSSGAPIPGGLDSFGRCYISKCRDFSATKNPSPLGKTVSLFGILE